MAGLTNFLNGLFNYLSSLLLIDFNNYSGNLPTQVIDMYGYVSKFSKL